MHRPGLLWQKLHCRSTVLRRDDRTLKCMPLGVAGSTRCTLSLWAVRKAEDLISARRQRLVADSERPTVVLMVTCVSIRTSTQKAIFFQGANLMHEYLLHIGLFPKIGTRDAPLARKLCRWSPT